MKAPYEAPALTSSHAVKRHPRQRWQDTLDRMRGRYGATTAFLTATLGSDGAIELVTALLEEKRGQPNELATWFHETMKAND